MMKFNLLVFALLALMANRSSAQSVPSRHLDINVLDYRFELNINDRNDSLKGVAQITCRFGKADSVFFDLRSLTDDGRGMTVKQVNIDGKETAYSHSRDLLRFARPAMQQDSFKLTIVYSGIPADGLIISRNRFGKRSFFADNWPNRAHHWIPCNDHPSDKATVSFRVTAPDHYQVIANGLQTEETRDSSGMAITEWRETTAIPTKVMVIGAAEFAVGYAGTVNGIPITSWIFTPDKQNGFYDYSQAIDILPFFTNHIAPYPFSKLANVQSKTIFGGMENAGCIFYYEQSVTGERRAEALLTHEIAHQWFGNSASEKHWSQLWLSEGFATYMTNLYFEENYGRDTLISMLRTQRAEVVAFYKKQPKRPVVDSLENNYMKLLNANSYQKGGWVLHMLRRKIGDSAFWQGVQTYYKRFAGGNAVSGDLQAEMEKASATSLDQFFRQWLNQPGHPQLNIHWKALKNGAELRITQLQAEPFFFPLTLAFNTASGNDSATISISRKEEVFHLKLPSTPIGMQVDPQVDLMAEWKTERVK